jgi:hypothetical protein
MRGDGLEGENIICRQSVVFRNLISNNGKLKRTRHATSTLTREENTANCYDPTQRSQSKVTPL